MNTLAIIAAVLIVVAAGLIGYALGARNRRIRAFRQTSTARTPAFWDIVLKPDVTDEWVARLAAGSRDDPAYPEAHWLVYNALNNAEMPELCRTGCVEVVTHLNDRYVQQLLTARDPERKNFWIKVVQEARHGIATGTTAPAAA